MTTQDLLAQAVLAKSDLACASTETKNRALHAMATALLEHASCILAENALDMAEAKGTISEVMLDRLALSMPRIEAMADGIRQVASLPDPVGCELSCVERPNGLVIRKIASAMGVIAIIYESRPNVTSDAAALAVKAGSACVLRCGKEAHRSAKAIVAALQKGLQAAGLPQTAVVLIEDTSRQSAEALMTARNQVDLLIPRGGKGLIRACVEHATVPVLETGTGICHIFVDKAADQEMALNILENAKCSRPSVCNAAEVCLVHEKIAAEFLPKLKKRLYDDRIANQKQPVQLRLDSKSATYVDGFAAGSEDFDTEFLDYILAVKTVADVTDAAAHIALHSTGHSEAIISQSASTAQRFTALVDSSAIYINASTRFTDGGEFGLGCEMGISTQKLHARGPLGLRELCSFKYIIAGNGQVR